VEFAEHGTAGAPLVARTIAHYLGIEDTRARTIRIAVPNDSAPQPFQLPGQDTVTPPVFTVPVVPIRP
jgi:hypothetical protein